VTPENGAPAYDVLGSMKRTDSGQAQAGVAVVAGPPAVLDFARHGPRLGIGLKTKRSFAATIRQK
jgi:hypothetical protein